MTTFIFTFTNREEYLTQCKEWLKHYKQAIIFIRERKHAYRAWSRSELSLDEFKKFEDAYDNLYELLDARTESRKEANRQYLAKKEAV